ncbi:MAG: nucleotidyltransferase domain-containing protein [Nanoarchaeota archaeon]|nr:nucleotidyltransferase domain-containing protein [Nanoarchaeota archaeon]
MDLNNLLSESSKFIKLEFNLQLEKSQLKSYSPKHWKEFCQVNIFDVKSNGFYIPKSYSAYVRTDSSSLVSDAFHELFGHGLFCEHSQIGKQLVDIIQNKGDEKSFLFDEVNPQEQSLGLCKNNIQNYEGFAVWLESLLCEKTSNSKTWQLKKKGLPDEYVALYEYFQGIEQKLTRFGFMSQLGFPKFYDNKKVIDTAKRLYESAFLNVNFVVLYGSQKPKSDIDLFIVSSNSPTNFFNGWLDIYEVNKRQFNDYLKKLDISITDPLFSGKLIYGDKNSFEQLKQQVLNQSITKEAINHNFVEAEKQKQYLLEFKNQPRQRKDSLAYIKSFTQNAEQLQKGNKPLTLKNLKQIYSK